MLAANITHLSRSPWGFPVVIVDKKDGTKRLKKAKQHLKKSSWPLPVIDDMLAALGKAKYVTTLDKKSGYLQIPLNEEDKDKMDFTCHRGLCKYNVMSFGLANAPGIFHKFMSIVLYGLEDLLWLIWMT